MRKGLLLTRAGLLSRGEPASITDRSEAQDHDRMGSRRGGRVVDCTGLLSRRTVSGTEGSNPSLSASFYKSEIINSL